jgi:hypothetical protein
VLQTGVAPPHSAFVLQLAQTPSATLQTGVGPVHFVLLVAEQIPHEPFGWHAGVAPPQSASLAQARHVCVAPLQAGVVPEQSALATQATHAPAAVLQTGVAPVQRSEFVAEHWPHDPPGWHAGVVGEATQSVSLAQAWQVCSAGSHTGVAPEQSESTRQVTQVPVVT